jgi:trigger factor
MQCEPNPVDAVHQKVVVTYSPKEVNECFTKELKKASRGAKVPGFRPGKAPTKILKQRFGARALYESHNLLVDRAWKHVIQKMDLEPMTRPEVDFDQDLNIGHDFTFSFSFEVFPTFDLQDHASLQVDQKKWTISETRLDEELNQLCNQLGEWNEIQDRQESEDGDQVTFSLKGLDAEGNEVDSLNTDEESVVLGSKQLIPELEASLIGKKVDDVAEVGYTFPDTHPTAELASTQITFVCTVKKIEFKTLLTLEELAEKRKEDSVDDLKSKIAQDVEANYTKQAQSESRQAVSELLKDQYTFEVPPTVLQRSIDHQLNQDQNNQSNKESDQDHSDEEIAEATAKVSRDLRLEALVNRLSREYKLKATEEEVREQMLSFLQGAGEFGFQLFQHYQKPENRERLEMMIVENKVFDAVLEQAQINWIDASIPTKAEEEEKAAAQVESEK